MYARLGFAVAARTDPDILLVDEVLSVGDARFQMRCFKRMQEFLRQGKTLIFVSHNLYAIATICARVLLLNQSRVAAMGDPESIVQQYRVSALSPEAPGLYTEGDQIRWVQRYGSGGIEITRVTFVDSEGRERTTYRIGESMTMYIDFLAHNRVENPPFGVAMVRQDGLKCLACNSSHTGFKEPAVEGEGRATIKFAALNLQPAEYRVSAAIMPGDPAAFYDHHDRVYSLSVVGKPLGDGEFHLEHRWSLVEREETSCEFA